MWETSSTPGAQTPRSYGESALIDRSIEKILAEWRSLEGQRQDVMFDPDLEARIERLPLEHAAAVGARRQDADELDAFETALTGSAGAREVDSGQIARVVTVGTSPGVPTATHRNSGSKARPPAGLDSGRVFTPSC